MCIYMYIYIYIYIYIPELWCRARELSGRLRGALCPIWPRAHVPWRSRGGGPPTPTTETLTLASERETSEADRDDGTVADLAETLRHGVPWLPPWRSKEYRLHRRRLPWRSRGSPLAFQESKPPTPAIYSLASQGPGVPGAALWRSRGAPLLRTMVQTC